jgi:drug/metabolite transporter (DMT)-like permease
MSILSYLGVDWPIAGLYLLPIAAFAAVLFWQRKVVKGRSRLRRAGTWVVMLCVFAIGWTVNLSARHTGQFEEGMMAGLAIVFVLIVDWFLVKEQDDR